MIPFNTFRYRLLVTVWPLCFAMYLASQGFYGQGGLKHPAGDMALDIFSLGAVMLLIFSAVTPRLLWVRLLSGLSVIGAVLGRAAFLFDQDFAVGVKPLAASVYALVVVSAIGWVMAADFAVVSREAGAGRGN